MKIYKVCISSSVSHIELYSPFIYVIWLHRIVTSRVCQAVNLTGPPPPEVLRSLAPPSEVQKPNGGNEAPKVQR